MGASFRNRIIRVQILLLSIVGNTFYINAQCWENINTTTTDWRETSSNNTWDWTQELFDDMYISGRTNPTTRYSPFWTPQTSTSQNVALFDFQKHTTRNLKDFHPEDGWELLVKNFGVPSGGTGAGDVDYPFFALYNKYTGKVRAFLLVPTVFGSLPSGALVSAYFPGDKRRSAIFQHMRPIGKDVQNFSPLLVAQMPNDYSNSTDFWLYAEFIVAYDPCTCEGINSAKELIIALDFALVTNSKIDAKIDGSFSEKVTENARPVGSDPSYSFEDVFDVAGKAIEAGQKNYKSATEYTDKFNKYLKERTAEQTKNKIWEATLDIKDNHTNYYNNEFLPNLILGTENLEYNKFMNGDYDILYTSFTEVETPTWLQQNQSDLEAIVSVIPYVAAGIGVMKLLIDGGTNETTTAVAGPTVFEANLELYGTIEKQSGIEVNSFFVPGFTTNPSSNFVPTYNNILGVFNILEIPDFEYYEITPNINNITLDNLDIDLGSQCEIDESDFNDFDGAEDVIFKQYKMTAPLKYVVNPASEMEVVSVEAAIVLEYKGNEQFFLEKPSEYSTIKAIPYYPLITKPSENDQLYDWVWSFNSNYKLKIPEHPIYGDPNLGNGIYYNRSRKLWNSSGTNVVSTLVKDYNTGLSATGARIDNIEANTNLHLDLASESFASGSEDGTLNFRTDYLPLTCLEDQTITLLGNDNIPVAYIKLYIKLKHKTELNRKPVTLILSYDIADKLENATKNSSTNGQYDGIIWAEDYQVTPKSPFVCPGIFSFNAGELSKWNYEGDLSLTSTPLNNKFFETHDKTYNGETFLEAVGNITIPDNSTLPPNTIIKAVGSIMFGQNLTIGSGTKFYSGKPMNLPSANTIFPDVEFIVENPNFLKFGCTNYNYASHHLSNADISTICNSTIYKDNALNYKREPDNETEEDTTEIIDVILIPNPTNSITSLTFSQPIEGFSYTVHNANGTLVLNSHTHTLKTEVQLDLSGQNTGLYFVNIMLNDGSIISKKLILL
ncbi:MAG: T9SS type A sorting domain-containing protein [Bacteroidia bacterium]